MHYAKMLKVSPPLPQKKFSLFSHARNIMQQTLVFYKSISIFQMRLHRFEFWVEYRQFVLEKFKQAVKLWYVSGSHSVNCSALPILFLYLKTDNAKPQLRAGCM